MSTVAVRVQRALPVSFVRREGDSTDVQVLFESKAQQELHEGRKTAAMLSILGRHWDSLARVQVDPLSIAGDDGSGLRVWNKEVGLPLVRAMFEQAAPFEISKEQHKELSGYYTPLAQAILFKVSPFADGEERLLTWTEFRKAIKEAMGGGEQPHMAILRGLRTFIKSQGLVPSAPSLDACVTASAGLTDWERKALAEVAVAMMNDDELGFARKELQKERVRAANAEAYTVQEQQPVTE